MTKYFIAILFTLGCVFISSGIWAQETIQGTIYFQQTDKFEYEPSGRIEMDQFAKTMPSEFKFEKLLHFDAKSSLFEKSDNPEITELSRRESWFLHRAKYGRKPRPTAEKIYYDFEKGERTEQLDFMTRAFLIESGIDQKAWKFTGSPKIILGYTCMSAETEMDSSQVMAWFTPEIPIPSGPEYFTGLPGMILAVEKNGETIYLATKIELDPVDEKLIKPTEGKKLTKEKLDKIIEEKIEEFKNARGKGDGRHGRRH